MSEEWGPWIEHDGKGCPCPGILAQWELDGAEQYVGQTDCNGFTMVAPRIVQGVAQPGLCWNWHPYVVPVLRYRMRRPQALRDLVAIAADPYAVPPSREVVPA